jgi:hypothetical protein
MQSSKRFSFGFDVTLPDSANWPRLVRFLLPTPGNVIFTLVVIGSLFWAQSAGAINLTVPVVASTLTIPYQGRLANANGTPFTGNQNIEFRLYNTPAGGTPLWSELWTGGSSVVVNDGLFSVLLGSLTAGLPTVVQSNSQLWLGITVGTDSEMNPRVQLGSAAYSMQALTVPDGSINSAKIQDGNVTTSDIGDGAVTKAKLGDNSLVRSPMTANVKIQYGKFLFEANCDAVTVSFQEAFVSDPIVIANQVEASGGYAYFIPHAITTTGFKVNKTTPSNCTNTGWVQWVAIGN